MFADLLTVRRWLVFQQILRRHQHSRRAKSTLQGVASAKGRLQIGNLAAIGQSLDGFDRRTMRLYRQQQASTNDIAVDAYRVRTADAVFAAHMRSGQLQMLAQKIRQIEPRQHMRIDLLTVDGERKGHRRGHAEPPARSGWPSNADTQRASNTFARCRRIAGDA